MKILGKTFIITGGTSGLGLATSKHLHSLGANLVIFDNKNNDVGESLFKEFGTDRWAYYCIDITNNEDIQNALNLSIIKFKEIHGVITCASISPKPKPTVDKFGNLFSIDEFTKTISINLIGTYNTIRLVSSVINSQNIQKDDILNQSEEKGIIIMVSTSLLNEPGQVAYCASKGAIDSMTVPLAKEFAPLSIRVMTIAPGMIDTEAFDGYAQDYKNSISFPKRMGRTQEFASLCQHIIENPFLNGEIIRLNGGYNV